MNKARQLKLDGLDALREELDNMQNRYDGWVFRLMGADEPHPISAVEVQAYNENMKKLAGIVLYEEHILDGTWVKMVEKFSAHVSKVTNEVKQ